MIWDMREAGVPVKRIAKHLGRQNGLVRKFIGDAGGRRPSARERSVLRLAADNEYVGEVDRCRRHGGAKGRRTERGDVPIPQLDRVVAWQRRAHRSSVHDPPPSEAMKNPVM